MVMELTKNPKFKAGNIVCLKSGGPEMTVDTVREYDNEYICVWFSGSKFQRQVISEDALMLASEMKKKEVKK